MRDPLLTLTRFLCAMEDRVFCTAYETLLYQLRDSLGCKCRDCCIITNVLIVTNVRYTDTLKV